MYATIAGQRAMSKTTVTDLVIGGAILVGLALYGITILRPAWTAYTRLWERLAAAFLSLYVLAVFVALGVAGGVAFVLLKG